MSKTDAKMKREDGMFVRVYNLSWLVLPLGFYLAFEAAYARFGPEIKDGDLDLLAFEALLFVAVVGFVALARKFNVAGWRAPQGLAWLWLAGPLWLGVVGPIALAAQTAAATAPANLLLWAAISYFVAINEETLFRGFILRGLLRQFSPVAAVLASSIAFGLMHFFNLSAGGDPIFVGAQAVSALGVGTIMAAMTLRTGSIWPAALLHFLTDAIGLTALGGYQEAIGSAEFAPSLIISGFVFLAWGLFWTWRIARADKVAR